MKTLYVLLCVSLSVSAQTIYRQVDADGRMVFSQTPLQQNAEALELVDVQQTKPVQDSHANKSIVTLKKQSNSRNTQSETSTKSLRPLLATIHHYPECAQSKQKLELAERDRYPTQRDKKGRERLLTESERNKLLEKLYKLKLKHCGS